jgi:glycosyltransferase involved in cell wall biosynthesis
VTPSFNQARYLEETIDSILGQGYPHLEYIVIDGGSTDGSVEIIKRYAPHLSFWCSERDPGQYFAIQKGFCRSSGEIMTWLNSDDKLTEHSLWYLAGLLLARPDIEWICGLHGAILENGSESGERACWPFSRQTYLQNGFDNPFIQQEGTFWRRSLWEKAESALDLRYSLAADMDLWRRFFRHASLYSLEMPLGLFRRQPTQRSHLFRAEYFREAERASRDEWELIRSGAFTTTRPGVAPLLRSEIEEILARLTGSSAPFR